MKTWIGTTAVLFTTLLNFSAFADGGVGSGGGGTLPAEKIKVHDIIEAVQSSRNVIDAFLKSAEADVILKKANGWPGLLPEAYSLLFGGPESVFDVLGKVQVQILQSGPCIGRDGKPYDGSVNTGIPYTICMSASQMQEKLTYANYRAETEALMLHEISHLLGSTEDQAVEIQKLAVRFFARTDSYAIFDWNSRVMEDLAAYSNTLEMTTAAVQARAKVSCPKLENVMGDGMGILNRLVDGGAGMFLSREETVEYYWQISTRLIAIADFLCTQPEFGDDFDRQSHLRRIEETFGGKDQIKAGDYIRNTQNLNVDRYPLVTVWIPRYQSIDDAVRDLASTVQDLAKLNNALRVQWEAKFPLL